MYPTTFVTRPMPAQAVRVCRPQHTRGFHNAPAAFANPQAFFAPHHSRVHPFSVVGRGGHNQFDTFDRFWNRFFENEFSGPQWSFEQLTRTSPRNVTFQPRFDVQETAEAYNLRGELPGVAREDVELSFSDNTLVIRGRTQSERNTSGSSEQQAQPNEQPGDQDATTATAENASNAQEASGETNDAASVHSESSYVRPSVEDEADAARRESIGEETSDTAGIVTPNTATEEANAQQQQSEQQPQQQQVAEPRVWVSERSVGSFARTFEFAKRVEGEGVTARLVDGILDVIVPKAKTPEARKITVN